MPAEPVVWIIDAEHWPRACIRAELIERGFDTVGFEEIAQALAALRDRQIPKPLLIILELRNQNLNQIELDNFTRFEIPIVLLGGLGELNHPLLQRYRWRAIFRRPISIGEICDAVEAILVTHH